MGYIKHKMNLPFPLIGTISLAPTYTSRAFQHKQQWIEQPNLNEVKVTATAAEGFFDSNPDGMVCFCLTKRRGRVKHDEMKQPKKRETSVRRRYYFDCGSSRNKGEVIRFLF